MKAKLLKYHQAALKKPIYLCANVLDPRSKLLELSDATLDHANIASRENLKEIFVKEAIKFEPPSTGTSQDSAASQSPITSTVADGPRSFLASAGKVTVEEEVNLYLNVGREKADCVPLDYWKAHKNTYPTLARMARAYFAVPAASVASEKSFSLGERILSEDRMSMTSDTCQALACLHSWRHFNFMI